MDEPQQMHNVFIARHGETTWNATGRYQGRLESELSPLGIAQAQALAIAMQPFKLRKIISSPLRRCMDTAAPAAELSGRDVDPEPLLIEIGHGTWEGRYRDDLEREDPERYRQWRQEPHIVSFENGESVRDVLARWTEFVKGFDPNGNTLIVTHDAVIRVAIVERLGRDLTTFWQGKVLNGAYVWFSIERGTWTLKNECEGDHLKGLVADPSTQAL